MERPVKVVERVRNHVEWVVKPLERMRDFEDWVVITVEWVGYFEERWVKILVGEQKIFSGEGVRLEWKLGFMPGKAPFARGVVLYVKFAFRPAFIPKVFGIPSWQACSVRQREFSCSILISMTTVYSLLIPETNTPLCLPSKRGESLLLSFFEKKGIIQPSISFHSPQADNLVMVS